MSHRQPPKYHKFVTIPLTTPDELNGMTIEQAISLFSSANTQNLISPQIHVETYDYDTDICVSGFQKMSDAEIQRLKDANLKRSQAAVKRQATIAQKEKETLIKLAKKYPEVVGYA